MAKSKKPSSKGVVKRAPKMAKSCKKPIPQQVVERSARARVLKQLDQSAKSAAAMSALAISALDGIDLTITPLSLEPLPTPPPAPRYPAPKPPGKKSKFWRQYQDTESGEFIGWGEVLKRTGVAVISRLRLRKTVQ